MSDDSGWSSFAKAAGLVVGVVLVIVIAGAIIGVSWWRRSGRTFIRDTQAAMEQGRADGLGTDEEGCLQSASAASTKDRDVRSIVRTNLHLRGCLITSKVTVAFCDGVPRATSIIDSSRWQREKCAAEKMDGPGCTVLGAIQEYCYSQDRRLKLESPEKSK